MNTTRPGSDGQVVDDSGARDALVAAINEEEAHIRRLETEQADVNARLEALRAKLASLDGA